MLSASRPERRLRLGLFLAAFFFYMLTGSRERPWGDATVVWQVAESITNKASVSVPTRWPYDAAPGRGGKYYAANPLLNSLVHLPGVTVRTVLARLWPASALYSWPLGAHLAPAALGALACVLFFALCREHGASPAIASLATIAGGAGSIVWIYARYPYSEILQVAFFTGAFLQVVRVAREPSASQARWLGFWAGMLLAAKTVYAVALPGAALYLLWTLRRDRAALLRVLAWTVALMLPALALYLFYNWARYGSAFNDGYVVGPVLKRGKVVWGFWGMLLSPGKSLFLYSPPLLVALLGLGALARRHRGTVILMAVTILPVLAISARLPVWHGDWAWGPRYTTFATLVLLLPLCLVLERVRAIADRWRARLATGAVAAVLGAGLVVQLLGNGLYWDHWIRLSMEARTRWLGAPNRTGAITPDRGGSCDACFEDVHQLHWIPEFQPIVGHAWLLRHVLRKHDVVTAEKDAPWHPTTTLTLALPSYGRARVDWWPLELGAHRTIAAGLLVFMLAGLAGGALLWRAGARRDPARVD